MDDSEKHAHANDTNLESISTDSEQLAVVVGDVTPKVHFSLFQTLGMAFSITGAPLAIGLYLSLVIGVGGSPFYIWGFGFVVFFQMIVCVAVAEIASAIPHSSGPAFWVQHLSPTKSSKFLGHLVGWLTVALWWFIAVAEALYTAQLTLALAIALNPGYDPPEWHYYLVYCAWSVALFTVNLPRIFKVLPHLLTAGVVVINATGIYLLIALLVRATPKPTAHQVFVEVVNESGWPSNGVVFFLALLPGMGTVNAFDSITHITDELDNPTKQVPQVMIGYGILASVTGFVMVIVYSFAIVNPLALYDPYGHQPLVQLIFDALRSTALSVIGCLGLILSLFLAGTAALTSWNRLHWSFAREGGLPFSRSMSRLTSKDAVPVNALIADLLLMIAMGAIQIGSLTALNAILGAAVTCGMISYALTFGLALWRGREFLSKDRWLNLGRFGTVLQVTTLLWCVFISIWLCFPLFLPVTLVYMNWTSLVLGCVVVLSTLYWFAFRKTIVHI